MLLSPLNMGGTKKYAMRLQGRGQWQRSIDVFRRAISVAEFIPPNFRANFLARGLRGFGFGLIAPGKPEEAEANHRETLKLDRGNFLALTELEYFKNRREKRSQSESWRVVER